MEKEVTEFIKEDLSECADKWIYNEEYECWALNNVVYTAKALIPKAQRLNIFVPKCYMKDKTIDYEAVMNGYTAATAPVIFENNSAGYREMPCVELGSDRCYARQYLQAGYVYVSCGNRGANSRDEKGAWCGKVPWNLVDLKTAIRFLRHNAKYLAGDLTKMISVGWSAGGAMSTLLAVTGNNAAFIPYLEENGAFMEESDSVFAAQIYCPIVDLEHADAAYEWMFAADSQCEDSPAGPAQVMTPFKKALSDRLKDRYVNYFNSLALSSVEEKIPLVFGKDARSGSAYDYFMGKIEESAKEFFEKLEKKELDVPYDIEQYMKGEYTYTVCKRRPGMPPFEEEVCGEDKRSWLTWDGRNAKITGLDEYVMNNRRRMKGCTSFDTLDNISAENLVFGSNAEPQMHFSCDVSESIEELKDEFSEEYAMYHGVYETQTADEEVKKKVYLYNPFSYIGTEEKCEQPEHYRICVGAKDADTSLSVSMKLACKLAGVYDDVTYKIIWDRPHCEADYEGDCVAWIESLIKQHR